MLFDWQVTHLAQLYIAKVKTAIGIVELCSTREWAGSECKEA